ncbi:MAG: hypothetical protein ACR2PX_01335 [Endozoicomonas sp.]|uniref:hypothetical protein n=1 Tax=Endozoicomonas sp. TaxID=1892382 RepID=UPI003D9B463E
MDWIKKNYKKVLLWCLVLSIAPFFIEIVFIADVLGAEVAIGFLILLLKDFYHTFWIRVQQYKAILKSIVRLIELHPVSQTHVYVFHTTASVVFLLVTGSMLYSMAVWYPIALLGHKLS